MTRSLLAARTKKAACWGDASSGTEGSTSCRLPRVHGNRCWSLSPACTWGLEVGYILGPAESLRPLSILADSEVLLGRRTIVRLDNSVIDCSFPKLVSLQARVMIEYNENDLALACES